ncbi:MAG: AbrB/MazE/SpoVT family DNA-binding domain-containing protein [Chloroflexi bacterium]|nr:AbrB/MazE/SpoVT family DNA-binding domain-containing protein [Chloroflexota bacterium]
MITTIYSAGRIVIPRDVRREAGLEPGMAVEVRCADGRVEIEPAPVPVTLEWRHGLLVAVPAVPVPPLTVAMVEATREALLLRALGPSGGLVSRRPRRDTSRRHVTRAPSVPARPAES